MKPLRPWRDREGWRKRVPGKPTRRNWHRRKKNLHQKYCGAGGGVQLLRKPKCRIRHLRRRGLRTMTPFCRGKFRSFREALINSATRHMSLDKNESSPRCAPDFAEKPLKVAARIQRGFVARWSWMFIHFRLAPCHAEFGQQWQAAPLFRASTAGSVTGHAASVFPRSGFSHLRVGLL